MDHCIGYHDDILLIWRDWKTFEGFNYAVIAQFISERYPLNGKLFDWGAFVCTLMGILFHPIHFDLLGIADLATTFVALYGMLMIRKHTKNSWGAYLPSCLSGMQSKIKSV